MDSEGTHLSLARNFLEKSKFAEAIQEYMQALKNISDDRKKALVWAEISWAYYGMQKFDRCIEASENVLHYDSTYSAIEDIFRLLGFSYLGLGKAQLAEQYLQKTLELDRTSEKQQIAIYELAKFYFKNQKYQQAEPLFQEIDSYFYQNKQEYWLSILFYRGFISYYSRRFDESEKLFESLLENSGDAQRKATALYGLAFLAYAQNNYLQTINLCESITQHDPKFFDLETVGFLVAASFHFLRRDDVFQKYYEQLVLKYPKGRYKQELDNLKAAIRIKDAN